jgi:rare lipoprotein A
MKTSKTGIRAGRTALLGLLVLGAAVALGGCKSTPAPADKAPAATSMLKLDPTDPVPHDEPLNPTANKWYGANGRLYRPITDDRDFTERGKATVIPSDMEGKATASGELFSTSKMTAAHSILPIPSYVRVTDLRTGRSAVVRVNDRGAYDRDETIAISAAVAQKIGLAANDEVQVDRITSAQIAAMPASQSAASAAAPAAPPPAPPPPVAVAEPQAVPPPPEAKPLPPPQPIAVPAPASIEPPPAAPVAAAATAPVAAAAVAPAAPAPTPRPAAAAAAPAPRVAATPPPTSTRTPAQSATTGRWSVQVAAFATPGMAESTRTRVAQQLAQDAPNLPEADRTPRVERYGNRSYVLLGDFADRDSAEALAGRLRAALRQDVVVDRH